MERLFVKSIIVFFAVSVSFTAFAQQKKVAVFNPICRDNSVSSIYFSVVRGSFESVASATDGFEVYNRTDLDAIASEMQFQQSGAVDDAQIRRIGKMAGVDFVLVTVLSADEGYLMVESKILNVESSQYDRAASKLMNMTPPIVEKTCLELAQSLFKINISSGIQNGEIMYNGCRYVGEYKEKKPHGKGKLYYNNAELNYYEGDFSDGLRSGYGKLVWSNGKRYEGRWDYDKINGKGTMCYENGDKYVGSFKNDKKWGSGVYYWNSGKKYEGEFKEDKRCGKGKQYYSNGKLSYDGEWKDDVYHGKGKDYFDDHVFVGEFLYGERWGNGIEFYDHSNDYWLKVVGYWTNGKKNGYFDEYLKDGTHIEGKYDNDVMVGTWYWYKANGKLDFKKEY